MLGYMYLSLFIVSVIFDIFKSYGFGVCPMLNYHLYVVPEFLNRSMVKLSI